MTTTMPLLLRLCLFGLAPAMALGAQEHPAPAAAAETPAEAPAEAGKDDAGDKDKKPPRRGIPVEDMLVAANCARCHARSEDHLMTRISYLRKSPEGWSESLKRMIRLHGVVLTPADAKAIVRSLSNSHGLARSEAERGLYESERRVHWSEEERDEDFKRACAQCHPLGKVLLQQRDDEEWQLLRATHVAMFPLSRGQIGGGPPEPEMQRFQRPPDTGSSAQRRRRGTNAPTNQAPAMPQGPRENVGDRVLKQLALDQPLFTDAWEHWSTNRRAVPLAGTWTVRGHEVGRGDVRGTATIARTGDDEYDVAWHLDFGDGSHVERTGKGLLYAGYSWRGRSRAAGDDAEWRDVLLLDDAWEVLRGRTFTGAYDEIGADLELVRDLGRPRVLAVDHGAVTVPATGHAVVVHGEAFPAGVTGADFFVGQGITITGCERLSDRRVRLVLDVAAGTALGPRTVAYGTEPGAATLTLYDTVDYVRITPLQGLARVGGANHPRQLERFEAIAVHRGKDEKPYTDDDVDLFPVEPRWGLAEFAVRRDDDDMQFVGTIDPTTGVFTPNVDGPNPARKWQANNVGDVFVTATVDLDVPIRPAAKAPAAKAQPGDPKAPPVEPQAPPVDPQAKPAPTHELRTFTARAHLIVTVPLYTRWTSLEWEGR